MDADYRQAVERLPVHKYFTKERLEEFINALARLCAHGKPLTVELLLNLGMAKRINSETSSR